MNVLSDWDENLGLNDMIVELPENFGTPFNNRCKPLVLVIQLGAIIPKPICYNPVFPVVRLDEK